MTNTQSIKAALISQIIDSGSNIPLSVLVGNIDLLINTAKAEKYSAISDKVMGSHITEPELTVEDLKAGEWYVFNLNNEFNHDEGFLAKFDYHIDDCIYCHKAADLDGVLPTNYNKTWLCIETDFKSIRHATREEIIKYFPHEFEIDSHGGNDIPQVTDPHL
jgi:hypothetical protein